MTPDALARLTPEEKRIRIAELCGWRFIKKGNARRCNGFAGIYGIGEDLIGCPPSTLDALVELPDYLNDLNAMHEAQTILLEKSDGVASPDLFDFYCQRLGGSLFHCAHATAAQRADAFLLTVG